MKVPIVHLRRYPLLFMSALAACGADRGMCHLPVTSEHPAVTCKRCRRTGVYVDSYDRDANQPLELRA